MLSRRAVLATALPLAVLGSAPARAATTGAFTLRLPEPSGRCRVGTTMLHLIDRSRPDPWNPSLQVRELMVTVYYPALSVRRYPVAPQITPAAARAYAGIDPVFVHRELPDAGVDWAATMSHAHTGAPAHPRGRPVLLYSPGGVDPRTVGTGFATELASQGYVVVTMDHPGETSEVEFPGGRVRTFELPGLPDRDAAVWRTMLSTRLSDIRFVIDALEILVGGGNPDAGGRDVPRGLDRALDLGRLGLYGHSIGGTAVAQAMYDDHRVGAAINLEGYLNYPPDGSDAEHGALLPIAEHGVDRPLFLVGTDGFANDRLEYSWSAMLAHDRGCTRRERLDDAMHWVFTDYGVEAPQLQAAGLMTAAEREQLVGAIGPGESVPAIRNYLRRFFSRYL